MNESRGGENHTYPCVKKKTSTKQQNRNNVQYLQNYTELTFGARIPHVVISYTNRQHPRLHFTMQLSNTVIRQTLTEERQAYHHYNRYAKSLVILARATFLVFSKLSNSQH